jgi:RHS repeat-associated protein
VQELDASNSPSANPLTGGGIDEHFQRSDSVGARNFLSDSLGSTLALTDSAGTLQTQYTYEPFGNVTTTGPASSNTYQYTGRENDGTGLYYYRARYYSPTLQRFIAQDPIGFAGGDTNLYGYVDDRPTNSTDPLGTCQDPCPKDKRRFFNWLVNPLNGMAQDLNVPEPLLLALAAKEAGWNDSYLDHNMPLNNPFGANTINQNGQAAGNIGYPNLGNAIDAWENNFGDRVVDDQDPAGFVNDLQHPVSGSPYNTQNPNYIPTYLKVYNSVLKWMKRCGIS